MCADHPIAGKSNQNRILQSFRRGLPSYHAAAVAQGQIAALLSDALVSAGAPARFRHGLEFGCGTGLLTSALLHRFKIDQLILNDLVAESATALQPILLGTTARTTFQAGPIETLPLPPDLDLIASASTVQWLADPRPLILRLVRHLAPGGWLAISGFGRSHFAELSPLAGLAPAPSYLDPQDWHALLPSNLRLHSLAQHSITLHFPDPISLLRHLRQTGVNAATHRHWTKGKLADFATALRSSQPGRADIRLSYSPVVLIAQKSV